MVRENSSEVVVAEVEWGEVRPSRKSKFKAHLRVVTLQSFQRREERWTIVDLVGKGGTYEPSPYRIIFAGREPVPPRDTGLSMQIRTKRPTGTWLQATDFCEIFDELLFTQKMLEVIPPNHAVEMSELLGT
jgi:hypothetical protein